MTNCLRLEDSDPLLLICGADFYDADDHEACAGATSLQTYPRKVSIHLPLESLALPHPQSCSFPIQHFVTSQRSQLLVFLSLTPLSMILERRPT